MTSNFIGVRTVAVLASMLLSITRGHAQQPDWPAILNVFDTGTSVTSGFHGSAMMQPVIPGIGSATVEHEHPDSCSYYPSTVGTLELLSAYLLTGNEKYRADAERQLAFAHSRENQDHLFIQYAAGDVACSTFGEITRDTEARQIYMFYFAYKILGNPLYLRWSENVAGGMYQHLLQGAFSNDGVFFQGFQNGLQAGMLTFNSTYVKLDPVTGLVDPWADDQPFYAYPQIGSYSDDTNQAAELGMGFWLLYNEPASIYYGSSQFFQFATNQFQAVSALQVVAPEAVDMSQCSAAAPPYSCVTPRKGAISLTDGANRWGWDESYGAYTTWSMLIAAQFTPSNLASSPGPTLWRQTVTDASNWLLCDSNPGSDSCPFQPTPVQPNETILPGQPYAEEFYVSTCTPVDGHPCPTFPSFVPIDTQVAWLRRFPIHSFGAPATDCTTSGTPLFSYLSRLYSGSDEMPYGGALYHSIFSLLNIPGSCYLPSTALPAYATDSDPVFLKRGDQAVEKMVSLLPGGPNYSAPPVSDYGHSLWQGRQIYNYPIVDVASDSSTVFVAFNIPGSCQGCYNGRIVKYNAGTAGQTMFNVQPDGVTQVQGFSQQIVGYQDFDLPISAIAYDGNNVFIALQNGATSRLLRYKNIGSGSSMFDALSDGIDPAPGYEAAFQQRFIGYQDYDSTISALASNGSQVYIGLLNQRLLRYDLSGAGTGGSMFYVETDGITALAGFETQFDGERLGYQDFNGSISSLSLDPVWLYVGLNFATASGNTGRVIRYQAPATGTGAAMFYADTSGIQALAGWENGFLTVGVGYQDLPIVDSIVSRGNYVYVTTENIIGMDSNPVRFLIKYGRNQTNGASLFLVQNDGVTRTFDCIVAPCTVNPETNSQFQNSMIEYTMF